MPNSSSDDGHGPSGSSSIDSPTLRTPGPPRSISVPPSTFGGLLRRTLNRNELRQAVTEAAADLEDFFHNAILAPAEATFRSSWNRLSGVAFPQQRKTYQGIKLMYRASDEVSLLDLRVANGPSFDSIEFNQLVTKGVEDGRRVRAVQRHSIDQATGTAVPTPTGQTDTELFQRYGITEDTPILPPMPGLHSRASSLTPSTGTGDGASSAAGINTPDGGILLQRNIVPEIPIHVDNLASLSVEGHTQLLLSVSEVKTRAKARVGLAQSLCYLVSSHRACGTWMGFLCVDLKFIRMVAVNESLFALETENSELQGQTLSPWELFERYRNDFFLPIIHSIEDQVGCDTYADTVFELHAIGAVLPTDRPLSCLPHPIDLRSWRDVESRAGRISVASAGEQLYLASEARRSTIGRVYHHLRQTMQHRNATSADDSATRTRRHDDSSDEDDGHGRRQKKGRPQAGPKTRPDQTSGSSTNAARSFGTRSGRSMRRSMNDEQPSRDILAQDTLSSLANDEEVDEADFLVAALLHHGLRITFVSPTEISTMVQERARQSVQLIQGASRRVDTSTLKHASHALATSVGDGLSS